MAKAKPDKDAPAGPVDMGIELEHFKVAVQVIADLIEGNKLYVFLSPPLSVRFVGDRQDFVTSYRSRLGQETVSDSDARKAWGEVRGFLQVCLFFVDDGDEDRIRFLESDRYDEVEKLEKSERERVHSVWREKLKLVGEATFSRALPRRARRLRSAFAPCFQDLDVEVVEKRSSGLDEESLDLPFLRFRIRYFERGSTGFPLLLISHPWVPVSDKLGRGMELEVDESDIDVMIYRLVAAKKTLLAALETAGRTDEGR